MAEIIGEGLWLTVGETGQGARRRAVLTNYVHPQVESQQVLGGKVDAGHLKFQKIINSDEIILWGLAREKFLFDRDRAKGVQVAV